jgi:hypothetical protein
LESATDVPTAQLTEVLWDTPLRFYNLGPRFA